MISIQKAPIVGYNRYTVVGILGLLFFSLFSIGFVSGINASAQHFTNINGEITANGGSQNDPLSTAQLKVALQKSIQEVRNNDVGQALANLNQLDRQLLAFGNSSSIHSLKTIMKQSIGLLQVGSADKALAGLNQAYKQFSGLPVNKQSTTAVPPLAPAVTGGAKATVNSTPSSSSTTNATSPIRSQAAPLTGANSPGSPVQASGGAGCTVIAGPAMTFRQVCPNGNNATSANKNILPAQPPSQSIIPAPSTPTPPLPSAPASHPLAPETPPLAVAGPSQTAATGIIVTLNGSGSYDPDGDKIAGYHWSESRSDPQVALSNNTAAIPSFASPIVKTPTNLTFFLSVNDGKHDSVPASTTVMVLPRESSPALSLNIPSINRNNTTTPFTPTPLPSQKPANPTNPPLVPRATTNAVLSPANNTNILSLLQNNPTLNSSSLPGTSSLNANTFKPYSNPVYGVSIQYPSNWRVEEGNKFLFGSGVTNVATFVPPGGVTGSRNYHTYVALSIEPSNSSSLTDYLKYTVDQYAVLPSFVKNMSNTNAVLGGNPAYILQYSDLEPGFPIKAVEIGTIIGDKAYFISYASDPQTYSNYLPIAYTMIKSLSINSINAPQNPVNPAQNNLSPPQNNLSPPQNNLSPPQNNLSPPQNNLSPPQNNLPAGGSGASGSIPK